MHAQTHCISTVVDEFNDPRHHAQSSGLSGSQSSVGCRTYSTLVMKHKGQGSRLQQVIDWLGGPPFDGCIVLDEAHKAKSFVPGKEAQSSKVGHSSSYEEFNHHCEVYEEGRKASRKMQ